MESTVRPIGRPPLGVGPRHTVAVKLEADVWQLLQEISRRKGQKPGPISSKILTDFIRSADLDSITDQEELELKVS